MKRLVVGDIHGEYDRLIKTLDMAGFDPKKDMLYGLGDLCDRGPKCYEVVEYLMSLGDHFKSCIGNHDIWLWQCLDAHIRNEYMNRDAYETWEYNGGRKTMEAFSVKKVSKEKMQEVKDFLDKFTYQIILDDAIIMHTPTIRKLFPDTEEHPENLTIKDILEKRYCAKDYDSWFWDRDILYTDFAFGCNPYYIPNLDQKVKEIQEKLGDHKLIICGHTPLTDGPKYSQKFNIFCIDTGAFVRKKRYGEEGCLTIYNLDTKKYVQDNGNYGILT